MIDIRGLSTFVQTYGSPKKEALLFLHGFTGTHATWHPVIEALKGDYFIITTDHIGHGQTEVPDEVERFSMEEQLKDLREILRYYEVEQVRIVGYSMGGRIALSFAAQYPTLVKQLMIESSSPGLQTEKERIIRRQSDEQLATRIERDGVEAFVRFWENIPLFETQKKLPAPQRERIRAERLSQRAEGLAGSLRGIGTGSQPSMWEALESLSMPITCIVGSLDEKYVRIAKEMKERNKNIEIVEVPETGHAIHVEKPRVFATIIEKQFSKLT